MVIVVFFSLCVMVTCGFIPFSVSTFESDKSQGRQYIGNVFPL